MRSPSSLSTLVDIHVLLSNDGTQGDMQQCVDVGVAQGGWPCHVFFSCRLGNLHSVSGVGGGVGLRGCQSDGGEHGACVMAEDKIASRCGKRAIDVLRVKLFAECFEEGLRQLARQLLAPTGWHEVRAGNRRP